MARPHYGEDELLAYLDANDGVVDLAEVERHLADCADCAEVLRGVEADYIVLSDPLLWRDFPPAKASAEGGEGAFASLAAARARQQMHSEQAERTYERLLRHPVETWAEHFTQSAEECTDSFVRRVIRSARSLEEREPREALRLLETAEALGRRVQTGALAKGTIGEIWKERANTLMVTGAYPAALEAWAEAEQAFRDGAVADFDLAFVAWGRASVYFEMGEYARALPLARTARRTLGRFGDRENAARAELLEACILHEQGDVDAAKRRYERLVLQFAGSADEVSLARVLANLACCRLEDEDIAGATDYAGRAIAIYARTRLATEITRTRWALARALLRQGRTEEGAAALERVAAEFDARGLATDAAEVRLDIVEDLLRREDYAPAQELARRLVATFIRAAAQLSVVRALTYLREASEECRATPSTLR